MHLHRKVSDLYRCAEFSTRALSKSHQSVRPNSAAVRHKYHDLYYLHIRFTLFILGQKSLRLFLSCNLSASHFYLITFFNYLSPLGNHGKLPSLFYRKERYRYRNDGHEQEYLYYSTYSDLLVFLSSLKFRRGRPRFR